MGGFEVLCLCIFLFGLGHLTLFAVTHHFLTPRIKPTWRGYSLILSLVLGFALIGVLYSYLNWYYEHPPLTAEGVFSEGEPLAPTAAFGLGLFTLPLSVPLCCFWARVRN